MSYLTRFFLGMRTRKNIMKTQTNKQTKTSSKNVFAFLLFIELYFNNTCNFFSEKKSNFQADFFLLVEIKSQGPFWNAIIE